MYVYVHVDIYAPVKCHMPVHIATALPVRVEWLPECLGARFANPEVPDSSPSKTQTDR